MKKNKKAFTLVELVIVIAVIAILAAVLLPTFSNVIANAKASSATQRAKSAIKEFYATEGARQSQTTDFTMNSMNGWIVVAEVGAGTVDYLFKIGNSGILSDPELVDHSANTISNAPTTAYNGTCAPQEFGGEDVQNIYDNCYIYATYGA